MSIIIAEVTRGDIVESRHHGVVVVADVTGRLIASVGDPERVAYLRSSAKPFQAVPLVESGAADAFGFTEQEVAMACASHDATPLHQRVVARMLAKAGLDEDALRCGVTAPMDEQEQARIALGLKPTSQIQCECSGEHAGMVAACKHLGYPLESYNAPDHPLQQWLRQIVAEVTRVPEREIVLGTDGCSIPTFGVPIRAFAIAYAALADPQRVPDGAGRRYAGSLNRLRDAMDAHPDMIAGDGNLDTDLMRLTSGKLVAKLGAEGVLCIGVPERGLGIAIVMDDGSTRGQGPATVAVLEQLELADARTLAKIREQHSDGVKNFAGKTVGELRPAFTLERH